MVPCRHQRDGCCPERRLVRSLASRVEKGDVEMGSHEWITLRSTNVEHVHRTTGISKEDLKRILRNNKDKGIYEVKVPLGVKTFTREER